MKKIIIIEKDKELLKKMTISLEIMGYYVIGISNKKEISKRVNLEFGDKLLIRLILEKEKSNLLEKKEIESIKLVNSLSGKIQKKEDITFYELDENNYFINDSIKRKIEVRGNFTTFSSGTIPDFSKTF